MKYTYGHCRDQLEQEVTLKIFDSRIYIYISFESTTFIKVCLIKNILITIKPAPNSEYMLISEMHLTKHQHGILLRILIASLFKALYH